MDLILWSFKFGSNCYRVFFWEKNEEKTFEKKLINYFQLMPLFPQACYKFLFSPRNFLLLPKKRKEKWCKKKGWKIFENLFSIHAFVVFQIGYLFSLC